MGTVNPYRPLTPGGSPEFPIEPRASTLPAPRAPTLPGGGPHTSPRAAMDFVTQHAQEGTVPRLLAGGALKAAGSVRREEALQVAPFAREQQKKNAMLEQLKKFVTEFSPRAVDQPSTPEFPSFVEWARERYPEQARRRWIGTKMLATQRKEYMAEMAAKVQLYGTQMRGYGTEMRARRPHVDPVDAAGLFPRPEDPRIRERFLEDRAHREVREDVVTKGKRTFEGEQARIGRAHELDVIGAKRPAVPQPTSGKQVIARQLEAKDYAAAMDTWDAMRQMGETDPAIASNDIKVVLETLQNMKAARLENPLSPPESELERDLAKAARRYVNKIKVKMTSDEIAKGYRTGTLTAEQARRHARTLGYGQ